MFKSLGWLYPSAIRRVGLILRNTAGIIHGKFLLLATENGNSRPWIHTSRILGGLQQSLPNCDSRPPTGLRSFLPETAETDYGLSDI